MPKKSLWSRIFGATLSDADAANSISAPLERQTPEQLDALEDMLRAAQENDLKLVTDGPLEDWLAQNRDPGLWHEIADGFDYDSDDAQGVLAWMLAQPDCQNAVATRIFVNGGLHVLCALTEPAVWDRQGPALAHLITLRERTGGFPADALRDAGTLNRAALLAACQEANARVAAGGRTPFLPAPTHLLGVTPAGPVPETDYVIGDSVVLHRSNGG